MPCSKQPPYSITASARGEFPWCCKAVSGSLRRQRQRSPLETSRGNGSPEAQRWHAGAEGSLAQIGGVCLSCIRYRVTAKTTRRIAMTIQILMRDIMKRHHVASAIAPQLSTNSAGDRVSSLGQGAGVSLYPARSMLRSKKAPPCRRARLRLGALDIRGRCGLPHESKFGVKRLVPEEGPHRDTCGLSHYRIYPQIAHSVPPIARFRFTVPNFPSDLGWRGTE